MSFLPHLLTLIKHFFSLKFQGSVKSQLDSPPKMFETYGFLRSLDGLFYTYCFLIKIIQVLMYAYSFIVQASMLLCHPDAIKFRKNFKAHKEELTSILYKLYNEKLFDGKLMVDVVWNKQLTKTAGRFHGQKRYVLHFTLYIDADAFLLVFLTFFVTTCQI